MPTRGWYHSCLCCSEITAKTIKCIYHDILYIISTCPKCKKKIENPHTIPILIDIEKRSIDCTFKDLYKLNIEYLIKTDETNNTKNIIISNKSNTPPSRINNNYSSSITEILNNKQVREFLTASRSEATIVPFCNTQF